MDCALSPASTKMSPAENSELLFPLEILTSPEAKPCALPLDNMTSPLEPIESAELILTKPPVPVKVDDAPPLISTLPLAL